MEKSKLSIQERKRLSRLNRELKKMNDIGYKHDGDEGWGIAEVRLESRYISAVNERNKLQKKSK